MTAKQRYIKLCEEQDTEWLKRVITPPSYYYYLTRTHVVLILLVLRRRGVDVKKLGAYHV